jgi:DNA-binding NarL/FixJ family response regulator
MIEVLFVDDSSEYCEFLRTALGEDPEICPIGEVSSGNDALTFCEIILPELILVNVSMPELDGIPVTKLIKEKYPLVKILAMDGSGNPEGLMKALEAGADGYFLKGIDPSKIREAVKNTMNGIVTIEKEVYVP